MCGRYATGERYNVAPGQLVPVMLAGQVTVRARWGFTRPGTGLLINARMETAAKLPTFRDAFARGRCLVPASGWFEWRRSDRQPFFLFPESREAFAFAGLLRGPADDRELVIVTHRPTEPIAHIHDRMPAALHASAWSAWLDAGAIADPPAIAFHPVSKRVGRASVDDATLIEPVELEGGLFG